MEGLQGAPRRWLCTPCSPLPTRGLAWAHPGRACLIGHLTRRHNGSGGYFSLPVQGARGGKGTMGWHWDVTPNVKAGRITPCTWQLAQKQQRQWESEEPNEPSLPSLRQVFTLQARPAILCYRGLRFLFFVFNIPSSQVCFGTALQKEKKKVTVWSWQIHSSQYCHWEPGRGREWEGGKRILKKIINLQQRNCQVPHDTQLYFLMFIGEVNKTTQKYPVTPSAVITAFTVAVRSIHGQQQDLWGCQE